MEESKIAVLIDGENISQNDIDYIFKEIKQDGKILLSKLYCGVDHLAQWKDACNKYTIGIVTQNNFVSGKNTTDSSLIIDAMDILYTRKVNTFYILSSDSDFTGIIRRIREDDKVVVGVGEMKTPASIINACNKFLFIENLRPGNDEKKKDKDEPTDKIESKKASTTTAEEKSITNLEVIIKEILDIISDDKVQISKIKDKIVNMHPEFNLKNYGKKNKFSDFLKEIPGVHLSSKDNQTWFAELKESPKQSAKKNPTIDKDIPSLDDIKSFIKKQISSSKDNKINIGQLHNEIKKEYQNFKLSHYKVNRFTKFISLYGDEFKFDNNKKPNSLMLNN